MRIRIEWVSLVVDVAIMSAAIREMNREYARFPQGLCGRSRAKRASITTLFVTILFRLLLGEL